MKMEKTKKQNLLVVIAVIFSLVFGGIIAQFSSKNYLGASSINKVYANEETNPYFPLENEPSQRWSDSDFSSVTLEGEGTQESPYLINNALELAYLSYMSRRTVGLTIGQYYKQMADIDLSGKIWTPIGTDSSNYQFKGIYDGNNKKITGMYVYSTSSAYNGLFAYINGAEIKNLTIENSVVNPFSNNYSALLAARALNSKVSDVHVSGLISGHLDGNKKAYRGRNTYVGGLFGYIENTSGFDVNTVVNVSNSAIIRGSTNVGGIAGYVRNVNITNAINTSNAKVYADHTGSSTNNVGGIVGNVDGGGAINFTNLNNYGLVRGAYSTVGGVVGISTNENVRLVITNSHNNGVVESFNDISVAGENRDRVGGIIGRVFYIRFENVHNFGTVKGRNEVGGLIGRSERETIINDSSNDDEAQVVSNGYHVGGLVGYVSNVTRISNSNNYGNIVSNTTSHGLFGTGGLVGTWSGKDSTIDNSSNHGDVAGSGVGGAIGYVTGANIVITAFENRGKLYSSRIASGSNSRGVGGVIGLASNAGSIIKINTSKNYGELLGSYVGGAVGNATAMGIIEINNFENNQNIILSENFENEIVENGSASVSVRPNYVGGIVGYSNARITIKESENNGTIVSSGNYVGGIVGRLAHSNSTIIGSVNNENITGLSYVGGIAGEGRGIFTNVENHGPTITATANYAGGIVGATAGATYTNVKNYALNIIGGVLNEENNTHTDGSYVGGLIGSTNSGSTVNIVDSVNYANVKGRIAVGGLIGRSVQVTTINNSHNLNEQEGEVGEVVATYYNAGGLVGQQSGGNLSIIKSNNDKEVKSNTIYITTIGNVSYATGGIIGAVTSTNAILNVKEVINNQNVEGQFVGGIVGFINISVVNNSKLNAVINKGDVTSTYNEALYSLLEINNPNLNNYGGYAGGLVGTGNTNTGAVTISYSLNQGNVSGRFVGGLVALIHTVDIIESYSDKDVVLKVDYHRDSANYDTSTRTKGVGGLVYTANYFARIYNSNNETTFDLGNTRIYAVGGLVAVTRNLVIRNSYNKTDIVSTFADSNENYAGGLVGRINNALTAEISNSYSYGNLSISARYLGGLVGRIVTTTGATAQANGVTTIKNVVVNANVENITPNNSSTYTGGLVGENYYSFNVNNIIVKGNVSGRYYVGGLFGQIVIQFNILNNLPYEINNVSYEGEIAISEPVRGNSILGGFIGHLYFDGNSVATSPEKVEIKIANSYNVAKITSAPNIKGGLVGYITFRSTNNTVKQFVKLTNNIFVVDTENGYINVNAVGNQTASSPEYREYTIENSGSVELDDLTNPATFASFNIGGTGLEDTYWVIIPTFNDGKPFLSNTYDAKIKFNANSGKFETGETELELHSKVGNKLTISEYDIAKPVREFYEFVGWSTNPSALTAEFVYGQLIEIADVEHTLYAIWQPERILIDIAGLGNLRDAFDNIVTDYYITTDTDYKLTGVVDIDETFLYWEVYNPATQTFEKVKDTQGVANIDLSEIINQQFIAQYAYLNTNGRKTITFQQTVTGVVENVSINFGGDNTVNLATIKVKNGEIFENYRVGSMIKVNKDDTITIKVTPKQHYQFKNLVLKDVNDEVIDNQVANIYTYDAVNDEHNFVINQRLFIEINIEKVRYDVVVKQVYNSANLLSAVEFEKENGNYIYNLVNDELLPTTVAINEKYAVLNGENYTTLTAITTNKHKFVNFIIYNQAIKQFVAYTPASSEITESFLNTFVNNGEIVIYAVFAKRFEVTFETISINNGSGEIYAYIRKADGTREPITSGDYVEEDSNIIIEAHASDNSVFAGFTGVSSSDILGTVANIKLTNKIDVKVSFELSYYKIVTQTIDNNNQPLIDNILVSTTAINLEQITVGTMVYKVGLLERNLSGYMFDGWYVNVNGVLISMKNIDGITFDDEGNISSFIITEDFVNNYANEENQIVIVAKFYELYLITIRTNSQKGSYDLYQVFDGGEDVLLDSSINALPYGMKVKIVPRVANADYYRFENYSGLDANDTYNVNDKSLIFVVNTNRAITLNFESIEIPFEQKVDKKNAKGGITFSSNTYSIGDTITITFEADSGYELRNWYIIDKNGKAHDIEELKENANYKIKFSNDTIMLTITESWIENFGLEFETKVATMMNSTYFTVLLVGGISIPILLAGVILLIILNNKKKAQAAKAAKVSAANQFGLNQREFLKSLVEDDSNNSNKGKQ